MKNIFTVRSICSFVALISTLHCGAAIATHPNIVWIISEDNSKHYLQHFDPTGAPTPNIESLAHHGVTFDRAFSNSPVCSVARTTLITSCYAPRIGTQFHRRIKMAVMPKGVKMFPEYLRAAGYYTTNNSKEDYNAEKSRHVWDQSSRKATWKNRPDKATPFFHVQTTTTSHESRLHFPKSDLQKATVTDRQTVKLPSYFPNTPIFRYTRARYHDRIMAVDRVVGQIIDELEEAGELENTFVFYFGDHGGVLPRSKGYLYEAGLHVPLVVRIPKNFQSLSGRELNTRTNGFVEFVDFGPTTLELAGINPPSGIDGKPFLGAAVDADTVDLRNETFGYADRFDEKYDLVRSLRQGKYKYIRNFEPFYPDGMQNNYRYKALAYSEWRQLHANGKLNAIQSQFFQPKPVEALHDLEADPHETNNLAAQREHSDRLMKMRSRLAARMKEMPDLSLISEAILVDQMSDPVGFGQQNRELIADLIDTANFALLSFDNAEAALQESLKSDDPLVRYWAIVACSSFGQHAQTLLPIVQQSLNDTESLVAMRAAEFVAIAGNRDPRSALYQSFQQTKNVPEALRILNTAVYLNDFHGDRFSIDAQRIQIPFAVNPKGLLERRLGYLRDSQHMPK